MVGGIGCTTFIKRYSEAFRTDIGVNLKFTVWLLYYGMIMKKQTEEFVTKRHHIVDAVFKYHQIS